MGMPVACRVHISVTLALKPARISRHLHQLCGLRRVCVCPVAFELWRIGYPESCLPRKVTQLGPQRQSETPPASAVSRVRKRERSDGMHPADRCGMAHPRGRLVLRISLVVVTLLALSALLFGFWCAQTEAGRAFVARRVERLVNASIPGRLEIGTLTQLRGTRVNAQHVRIFHPDGRCLLSVDESEVVLDVLDALQGKLGFQRAAATGGFFSLAMDPDDRLSFEAAVNAKTKPGEPHDPYGGLHYSLRRMYARNLRVLIKIPGQDDYQIKGITGFVTIRRIESPGTQVILQNLRGDLRPDVLDQHVSIDQLDGWVHGKERKVIQADVALRVNDDKLGLHVDYYDREKEQVKLKVLRKDGVAATATTWLLHAMAGLSSDITVDD
ncbi:MAG: hypothetical protein RL701_3837 [Pseudomonadota bacterium]